MVKFDQEEGLHRRQVMTNWNCAGSFHEVTDEHVIEALPEG